MNVLAPARYVVLERIRAFGEPAITGLDPMPQDAELKATGWTLIEQLDTAQIDQRYFAMRTDCYCAQPAFLAGAGAA